MESSTEVQDYIRRFTSISPEKDITVIDGKEGIEIYSIGDDGALYLAYQNCGNAAEYYRVKILDKADKFAAAKIAGTAKVAIAAVKDGNVILAITDNAPELSKDNFKMLNLAGMLGGKELTPVNLLIAALEQGMTLFIEMKDSTGRIEQFACVLDSESPESVKYYPLASNFSSVVCSVAGRAVRQYVDGIYTCGEYGGTKQLLYTPSCNIFGTTPPAPLRLKNSFNVERICALPLSEKIGTHLFAVGDKGLYFYPYDRQLDMYHTDNPDPDFAISSEFFNEAKKVAAMVFNGILYVYVLNESNILSYTYAEYQNDAPSDFKEPVQLMDGVYYFNLNNEGTMAVCTADKAVFGKQDPVTGSWSFNEACIETTLDEYRQISAYVTKITTNMPNEEAVIRVKGNNKASCYINEVYHNFLQLSAKTDIMGVISIVQQANDFNPASFSITVGGKTVEVNPAEDARKKVLSLNDIDNIKSENIYYPNGNQSKLFENADNQSLSVIAAGMSSLRNAASGITPGIYSPVDKFKNGVAIKITDKLISVLPYDVTHNPFTQFVSTVVHNIEYAFNWVKDKVKWLYDHTIAPAVDFVIAKTQNIWRFIAKVGEKVLELTVNTITDVFGAVKKLLEFIGIPIDKIFNWLKKKLGIDQVQKTNDVMKKMMKLSGKKLAEQATIMKGDVIQRLDKVIKSVELWANIDHIQAKSAAKDFAGKKMSDTGFNFTSQNTYMFNTLFSGLNMREIAMPKFKAPPELSNALNKLDGAIKSVSNQFDTVTGTIMSIGDNIVGIFGSGDIFEICNQLKQILGKVAVAGLETCKAFIGLVFDVVTIAIEAIIDTLLEPIHIPFISQILKIFGIDKFSFVDLITFPTAFFVTTVTKLSTGQYPFSEEMYKAVMEANSLDDISVGNMVLA